MRQAALLAVFVLAGAACSNEPSVIGSLAMATATASEPAEPPNIASPPPPAEKRGCAPACLSIERCDENKGECLPNCPPGEVYIPKTGPEGFVMGKGITMNGGARRLGKGHRADSDRPHKVILTKPFCMDETEVTVAAMKPCVEAGKCKIPKIDERWANYPSRPDHPVNEVSYKKAKQFCKANDKDLPTEAQWEWAATGGDGRKWPWGNEEPTCEHADFVIGVLVSPGGDSGCGGGGTSPVRSHLKGNRIWPTGTLYDLAGNVWEWCDDTWGPYPADEVVDPRVQDHRAIVHVVRGGGWNRSNLGIQTTIRGAAIEGYQVPGLGFRCVRNPSEAP